MIVQTLFVKALNTINKFLKSSVAKRTPYGILNIDIWKINVYTIMI